MISILGRKSSNGSNVTMAIYSIKKNVIDIIGYHEYNTNSFIGDESDIFSFLHDKKVITDKLFNSYKGYYLINMKTNKKLSIQII